MIRNLNSLIELDISTIFSDFSQPECCSIESPYLPLTQKKGMTEVTPPPYSKNLNRV